MAGRETSGFAAADRGLFAGCAWVLCLEPDRGPTPPSSPAEPDPSPATSLADWLDLATLVTSLGARAVPATADEHDRAVALVSHVPHLLAAALAGSAASDPLALTVGAGSFRDGTRVAASPPALIAAICGGNATAVGPALDAVLDVLHKCRAALDAPNPIAALRPLLDPGYTARTVWPPEPGKPLDLPARTDALLRLGRAGGWVTAVAEDRRTVTAVRPAS
jgi:prephenate dehydrogenase